MPPARGRTKVEDEGGRVVWVRDSEAGVEAVRDMGEGGGEEGEGVGASGVASRGGEEALGDKFEENGWWDCDTEGRGKGGPDEEDEPPTDPACASRRPKVPDILAVGV